MKKKIDNQVILIKVVNLVILEEINKDLDKVNHKGKEEKEDLVTGVVVDGNVVEADCVIIGTKALALLVQTYKY